MSWLRIPSFYLLLILTILYSGTSRADVFLAEATKESGYGATKVRWASFWSGVCAERVGLTFDYGLRGEFKRDLAIDYAQSTVPHLVRKCAELEIIHVNAWARHRPGKKRQRYIFELHKSTNWKVQNGAFHQDIINDKLASGFIPASATPLRYALIRLQDNQFEALYGPKLKRIMSASSFSRHYLENVNPPRISHHIISGEWFELGSDKQNGSCEESRNGYALWGTFTLRVGSGSSAKLNRKFCAAANEKGHADALEIRHMYSSELKRVWNIDKQIMPVDVLNKTLVTMEIQPPENSSLALDQRKPLYELNKFKIYSTQDNICIDRKFEAFYDYPNEQRDDFFSGDYEAFVGDRVAAIVKDYCGDALTASVRNYTNGDTDYWDRMSFKLRPSGTEPKLIGERYEYPRLISHRLSEAAKAHQEYLIANHFGVPCTNDAFCELPAGKFLNAVYQGNADLLTEIDQQYQQELDQTVRKLEKKQGGGLSLISKLMDFEYWRRSLIIQAINKYMYDYQGRETRCFSPQARSKTFRLEQATMSSVNPDGTIEEGATLVSNATYRVNPEFYSTLEFVGTSSGAPSSDTTNYLGTSLRLILKGLVAMKDNYDCDSKEVKTFESNLIAFAQQVKNNEKLAITKTHQQAINYRATNNENKTQQAVINHSTTNNENNTPQPAQADSENFQPNTLSEPVNANSQLSPKERRKRMNEELKEISNEFLATVNKENEAFKAAMGNAKTQQEKLGLIKSLNEKMVKIQKESDEKVKRVKDKYK